MARVQRGDEVTELAPDEVQVGDTIIVEPNEVIPLDGEVLEDMSAVDISPLTGRAGTRTLNAGGAAMSGSINLTRTIRIKVTRKFKDSTVRRLCDIAANTADVRSGQERFTARFACGGDIRACYRRAAAAFRRGVGQMDGPRADRARPVQPVRHGGLRPARVFGGHPPRSLQRNVRKSGAGH